MTFITTTQGYLDAPYLEGPYLTSLAQGALGSQATFTIEATKAYAFQSHVEILDSLYNQGIQASVTISDTLKTMGMQAQIVVNADKPVAMQTFVQILDSLHAVGMQGNIVLVDRLKSLGFEVRLDRFPNSVCPEGGYLEFDYLAEPYLSPIWCSRPGAQVKISIIDFKKNVGMQSQIQIADRYKNLGLQTRITIANYLKNSGMQADVVKQTAIGQQVLATIYNVTNLRLLCDFPSRGLTATNWTSNSTAPGDYSIQNVDTDIIEQIWKSNNDVVGVRLVCDTGLTQGVFLDTLAILNHNFTKSADVVLLGSNDPTFVTIGVTIPLQPRLNNMYYIAPTLPTSGYRYWRLDLDDATNSDGFLSIGTLLFGASEIFQGEDIVDEIEFELKDFADTTRTEGFTNVANSRTQKRRLRLDFRSLRFQLRNFRIMRDMFERERTVSKCLWVPTPSATDQESVARFAVFSKMVNIPTERHNNKGADFDYVTFTIDLDESL